MFNTKTTGKIRTLLLTIMTLILILALAGCEKNTPIVYTTEGGHAQVSVVVESGGDGDRAAATPFTVTFTLEIEGTGEELEREIEVADERAQGVLEVPADTPFWLSASTIINGAHYHGGYPQLVTIAPGEIERGITIFMHEEFEEP